MELLHWRQGKLFCSFGRRHVGHVYQPKHFYHAAFCSSRQSNGPATPAPVNISATFLRVPHKNHAAPLAVFVPALNDRFVIMRHLRNFYMNSLNDLALERFATILSRRCRSVWCGCWCGLAAFRPLLHIKVWNCNYPELSLTTVDCG